MKTDAPNFKGNYPLGGDRIGPAWLDLWEMLDTERYQCGWYLADQVADRNNILARTAHALLSSAASAEILDQVRIDCTSGHFQHRRKPIGYRVRRQ